VRCVSDALSKRAFEASGKTTGETPFATMPRPPSFDVLRPGLRVVPVCAARRKRTAQAPSQRPRSPALVRY
jgi:hypothetical protein